MTEVGVPVDIRVPVQYLPSVKVHLLSQDIQHDTMIEDLQVQTH